MLGEPVRGVGDELAHGDDDDLGRPEARRGDERRASGTELGTEQADERVKVLEGPHR